MCSFFFCQGQICPGNSLNLPFVPDSSFDLVYTGYITPNEDPLKTNITDYFQRKRYYMTLCKADPKLNPKLYRQRQMAQDAQDAWYSRWVGEMIRIAKPGASIVVEMVSHRQCDDLSEFGGVKKAFWFNKASEGDDGGWDIDPESIEFADEHIYGHRYHVAMKKNG